MQKTIAPYSRVPDWWGMVGLIETILGCYSSTLQRIPMKEKWSTFREYTRGTQLPVGPTCPEENKEIRQGKGKA